MIPEPEDPVVAETRAVRRELAERFGDDVGALCDFLIERETEHQALLVNHPPKPSQYVSVPGSARERRTG